MLILTNFMNSPDSIELPNGGTARICRFEDWKHLRAAIKSANLIVIDCRDALLYRVAAYFLLFPWRRKPLVAVDVVLRKPIGARNRASASMKRLLFSRVTHFIHYFRDVSGYSKYFGITATRSSYVPFKVNLWGVSLAASDIREDYIFTMGVSLRDYDTFVRAVAELPYPAAIPEFSFKNFEGKTDAFPWTEASLPKNVTVLRDSGSRDDLAINIARARIVVIPTQAASMCASGISTYLSAMYLEKCVISSTGPGASDVLTDQAILVPPHDVSALREAIRGAWVDDRLRNKTRMAGYRYALSLGGEPELLQRIYREALRVFSSASRKC